MNNLLVMLLVGFAAQLVDGSLGMAYGVTSTTLLLSTGMAPAVASASVHLAEVGTTLASGLSHWRFGNVDWRTVRMVAVPGAVGAFLGAVALSSLSTEAAKPWVAGLLLALGFYILTRFSFGRAPKPRGRSYVRHRYLAGLGLVAGFVDASGGGGWGPIATPTLIATGKMEPRKVIGSVDTSEFIVSVAASLGFLGGMGLAGFDLRVVGVLLLGGLLAAPLAAWLVRHLRPRILGCTVGGLIILTNGRTILNALDVAGGARAAIYVVIAALWSVATIVTVRSMRNDKDRAEDEVVATAL
ncbi:MAG: sulfite exporter TauE/SafE family protein [Acidimicrobiia bacterium]|nr:sulfite exporter TauE/SafE family protein [Acidimicrobiia bacterium]